MSLKHGIPEPWKSAIIDANLLSPWGDPSLSRLAEQSGVHVATISRVIKGGNTKGPKPEVIRAIAEALGKPPEEVAGWASLSWEAVAPYIPPEGAMTMTKNQRSIVDSIIREFATQNTLYRADPSVDAAPPGSVREATLRKLKSTDTGSANRRK